MPSASSSVVKELHQRLPEFAAGCVEEHDRHHVALAGLQQREHFQAFVERAEAAGQETTASHSFTNISLRVKKYFMCTSFGSPAMTALDDCSKGSMMFRPIEFSRPAPTWPASMMPLAAPVTTSQPCFGHLAAEGHGLLIGRLVGPRAGRAKHRHFAARAIGREDLEGVAQFAQRAAEDFQIAARRLIGGQLVGRFLDLLDQVGNSFSIEWLGRTGHGGIERLGNRQVIGRGGDQSAGQFLRVDFYFIDRADAAAIL